METEIVTSWYRAEVGGAEVRDEASILQLSAQRNRKPSCHLVFIGISYAAILDRGKNGVLNGRANWGVFFGPVGC